MSETVTQFRNCKITAEKDENDRPLYSLFKNHKLVVGKEKAIRYIKQIMYQIAD